MQTPDQETNDKKPIQKLTAKEMFHSPVFYYTFLPYVASILLVIISNSPYSYAFIIFYLDLIIDTIILSLSILFSKPETVRKMYKSTKSKSYLAMRSLGLGLAMCLFLVPFSYIIFFLTTKDISITSALTDKVVLLSATIYLVTKIINLIINIRKYHTGQQAFVDTGESFASNFITLLLTILIIFPVVLFLPGILFSLFKDFNFMEFVPLVAITFIFFLKAYIEAALAVIKQKNN